MVASGIIAVMEVANTVNFIVFHMRNISPIILVAPTITHVPELVFVWLLRLVPGFGGLP